MLEQIEEDQAVNAPVVPDDMGTQRGGPPTNTGGLRRNGGPPQIVIQQQEPPLPLGGVSQPPLPLGELQQRDPMVVQDQASFKPFPQVADPSARILSASQKNDVGGVQQCIANGLSPSYANSPSARRPSTSPPCGAVPTS